MTDIYLASRDCAVKLLQDFGRNAYKADLSNLYQHALETLYGPSFDVVFNYKKRMEFFCYICQKDMNCVQSLEQHALSGQHLRKKSEGEDIQIVEGDVSEFSFFELIQNAPVPVIGLQYIEAYEDDPDSVYYKCNLCGDHGDKCYIYYHVIGDQHTDKYIVFVRSKHVKGFWFVVCTTIIMGIKVKLEENRSLNLQRRLYLRKEIWTRETFTVHDITTYVGKSLYPYRWIGKPQKRKKLYSSRRLSNDDDDDNDIKISSYKSKSKKDKEIERSQNEEEFFSSYSEFKNIVLAPISKFVFVDLQQQNMKSFNNQETTLRLAFYMQYILYLVTNGIIKRKRKRDVDTADLRRQRKKIKNSIEILKDHLLQDFKQKFERQNQEL